jgi:hypothetical protein
MINAKKMKRFIKITLMAAMLLYSVSCRDYLDIVPDNTATIEDYFMRREMAWNALAKVYSYLPADPVMDRTSWTLGDEWIGPLILNNSGGRLNGIRIMRGLQNSTDPILGHWSGSGGGKALYQGIRSANIFIENIDMAEDMPEEEKKDWKAQAKFLKAYYHFLLLRQYGPVVIADLPVPLDALSEDLYQRRSKVEDCFDYIISLMDEAIADLAITTDILELGRVDKAGATAIKARMMLYRASPFYNGNSLYYVDFLDFDGQPFFPMQYDPEKWKQALDAIDTAIAVCESNKIELYTHEDAVYAFDRDDYNANPEAMQTLYDLRMLVVDPWNKELIWGQTYAYTRTDILPNYCNIRLPEGYGDFGGTTEDPNCSWQNIAASYAAQERYYTKNGLPLDYDREFNKSTMYDIVTLPGLNDPRFASMRGIMQPGARTVRMYLDREPRFYANLGITGGYWRAHTYRINAMMTATAAGGFSGRRFPDDYFVTGIGVQKLVHPESKSGGWQRVIRYPQPIIRMADLYLMRAEALNEYYGTSAHAEAYREINKVRRRAGIPDVEEVWSNGSLTRQVGRHLSQDGLREIILEERANEFAFEGIRFWDMYRYRRAVGAFSAPIMGWQYDQAYLNEFFTLSPKQTRRFIVRDYLWPISVNEINKNSNIIQNPGW